MPVFGTQMFGSAGAEAPPEPIDIDNSCRFDGASAYMSFTPSSNTDRRTWTVSFWWKFVNKASNEDDMAILSAGSTHLFFDNADNKFTVTDGTTFRKTTATFTDVSNWHHLVVAVDSTSGVVADRMKVYLDGSEITSWTTNNTVTLNFDFDVCSTSAHLLGQYTGTSNYLWGYVAEFYIIDGEQKDAEDFGMDDSGTWTPIAYSGSYGTNGCYLDFEDSGNLGDDESGNGNDFTETNIAAADQMLDTPTENHPIISPYTDTGAGHLSGATISEGGLKVVISASALTSRAPSTLSVNSGKWYWEGKIIGASGGSNYSHFGIWASGTNLATSSLGSGYAASNEWIQSDKGNKSHNGSRVSNGLGNWSTNDIVQMALDMDNNKIWFGVQNSWEGDPAAGSGEGYASIGDNIVPFSAGYGGGGGQGNWELNFGNKAFIYTPPSGFLSLESTTAAPVAT